MGDAESSRIPPYWEKLRVLSSLFATILIPLVVLLAGHRYTAALKQSEIGIKYVELAISILTAAPEQQTAGLRRWAIDVINHHADVPLSSQAARELETQDLSAVLKMLHDTNKTVIKDMRF